MHNNPVPVAVGVVPFYDEAGQRGAKGHFLFVRRALPPVEGLACVSGYVDEFESAEEAMARELFEEAGIQTKPEDWVVFATRCASNNRLLVFMTLINFTVTQEDLDRFTPNSEVSELVVGTLDTELVFPLHSEILKKLA